MYSVIQMLLFKDNALTYEKNPEESTAVMSGIWDCVDFLFFGSVNCVLFELL